MNPNFQNNATAAESFRRLSQEPDEQEFWAGYVRGLRRNHHGEKFETEAEHSLWMSAADSSDQSRKMRGLGYRAGFEGQNVQAAMKTLVGHQHMSELGKRGGSSTSVRKSQSSAENGRLGGRPRKPDGEKNG
jgi:hypothetical protein